MMMYDNLNEKYDYATKEGFNFLVYESRHGEVLSQLRGRTLTSMDLLFRAAKRARCFFSPQKANLNLFDVDASGVADERL